MRFEPSNVYCVRIAQFPKVTLRNRYTYYCVRISGVQWMFFPGGGKLFVNESSINRFKKSKLAVEVEDERLSSELLVSC